MKYEIVEMAWKVNPDKFQEPWHHGGEIYYGSKGSSTLFKNISIYKK
jgi:hypothetical protein